jgi:excisionase family DNA binding protein
MRITENPLLISLPETAFQLSLSQEGVVALIRDGEITAVKVRDQLLIAYDSVAAFTRRAKRNSAVTEVPLFSSEDRKR